MMLFTHGRSTNLQNRKVKENDVRMYVTDI